VVPVLLQTGTAQDHLKQTSRGGSGDGSTGVPLCERKARQEGAKGIWYAPVSMGHRRGRRDVADDEGGWREVRNPKEVMNEAQNCTETARLGGCAAGRVHPRWDRGCSSDLFGRDPCQSSQSPLKLQSQESCSTRLSDSRPSSELLSGRDWPGEELG
jgi:hypothetical protein